MPFKSDDGKLPTGEKYTVNYQRLVGTGTVHYELIVNGKRVASGHTNNYKMAKVNAQAELDRYLHRSADSGGF